MNIRLFCNRLAVTTAAIVTLATLYITQTAYAGLPGQNGKMLMVSDRDGDFDIYTLNLDGSNPINLTNDSTAADTTPSWTPDGKKIVFASLRDSSSEQIYIMNADGSNKNRLTNNAYRDLFPSLSTAGDRIFFESDRGGGFREDVYAMNLDGSNVVRLTNTSHRDRSMVVSPNGSKIVMRGDYNRISTGSAPDALEIYTMNADGTNIINVTNSVGNDSTPQWSPDSSKIVWLSSRSGVPDIYTMNADGTDIAQLTNDAATETGMDFTPNGLEIVYTSNTTGNNEIYIMNVDGSNKRMLTTNPASDISYPVQPLTIIPSTINTNIKLDATQGNVIFNTLANHTDIYGDVDPASVRVVVAPQKGTTSVNATTGEITYTPNTRKAKVSLLNSINKLLFKPTYAQSNNEDSFTYSICSSANTALCTTNTVVLGVFTPLLADTGQNSQNILLLSLTLFSLGGISLLTIKLIKNK